MQIKLNGKKISSQDKVFLFSKMFDLDSPMDEYTISENEKFIDELNSLNNAEGAQKKWTF